jgi:uncharacterized protein (TIGR02588 family)
MSARRTAAHAKQRRARAETPLLEWLLGAAGLVLLATGIAVLGLEGLRGGRPGGVRVVAESTTAVADGYLVRLGVHNLGSASLADLHLKARLLEGSSELESVQLTLDYLPGHATRKAGLYLRHDPARYRLELFAEGYQEP